MVKRGVVVTCPVEVHAQGLHLISSELDPLEVRRWLLYWDRIDWPVSNVIHIGSSSPDVALLEAEGILSRTKVNIPLSGPLSRLFVQAQATAFQKREREAPGAWSMAQPTNDLLLPDGYEVAARTADVSLAKIFPAPMEDVPLAEILDFKIRRAAELQRFRAALDSLYQEILSSADEERAKLTAAEEISRATGDLDRVLNEKGINRFFSSMKVSLNLKDAAVGAATLGAMGAAFQLPLPLTTALGAIQGGIAIQLQAGGKLDGLSKRTRDFAYLGYVRKDLPTK